MSAVRDPYAAFDEIATRRFPGIQHIHGFTFIPSEIVPENEIHVIDGYSFVAKRPATAFKITNFSTDESTTFSITGEFVP
jgi:hypothetical protein